MTRTGALPLPLPSARRGARGFASGARALLLSLLALAALPWGCNAAPATPGPPDREEIAAPLTSAALVPVERTVLHGPPPPRPPRGADESIVDIDVLLRDEGASTWLDGPYLLSGGDRIEVIVHLHPELTTELTIPYDGFVEFPLVGRVEARARSSTELAKEIKERLQDQYVRRAQVSVHVQEYAQRKAYILGGVNAPGAYDLPPGHLLTLMQLVSLARGFRPGADSENIQLIRAYRGKRTKFLVSFRDIEERGRLERDVPLRDGDVVLVGDLEKFRALGSVVNPGEYPLPRGAEVSLSQALAMAGGFTATADLQNVALVRLERGVPRVYTLSLDRPELLEGPYSGVTLAAGDALVVPQQTHDRAYVLGSVARPGGYALQPTDLTVTQVVALAGGYNRLAAPDRTRLIRKGRGEPDVVIEVPILSILQRGETKRDPVLEPGDIVFVPESIF